MARHQQLARAAGPMTIAWLGGKLGFASVFGSIAIVFNVAGLESHRVLGGLQAVHIGKETV